MLTVGAGDIVARSAEGIFQELKRVDAGPAGNAGNECGTAAQPPFPGEFQLGFEVQVGLIAPKSGALFFDALEKGFQALAGLQVISLQEHSSGSEFAFKPGCAIR